MTLKVKQRGVALFVTLLVVAIATLLATEIWFNNTLDISRQYNNRSAYQANHYARGMALWAKDALRIDFEQDEGYDNHAEEWNQTITGIQLEDAMLSGQLYDLDSKFNLNNLVINNVVNDQSDLYFRRILTNLELHQSIADKIIDWLDKDQSPMPQGAEDTIYLSKSPSYRSSGQPFVHISELRLIDGINEKIYQQLKEFVTVLPVTGNLPTRININTASALLLKSLDVQIKTKDALLLYNEGSAANKSVVDFFNQPAIRFYNLNQGGAQLSNLITVRSQWFEAEINVKMEQTNFKKFALLHRQSAIPRIMQWSDTSYH